MGHSIFIAQLFGPLYVLVILSFLLKRQDYQRVAQDIVNSPGLKYICGVAAFLVGLLIVLHHNIWVASWVVIITLIGWMALIKGILFFIFPDSLKNIIDAYQAKPALFKIHLSVGLILGLFLTCKGYF